MTLSELQGTAAGLFPEARRALELALEGARTVGRLRARDEAPQLAVVGRMKTGKSTFINTLLAGEVAATHSDECTTHLVTYRHGSAERWLEWRGGSGATAWVPVTKAAVFAANNLAGSGAVRRGAAPPVRRFVAELPCPFLRDWSLIDTPGYDGESARRWPKRFEQALGQALEPADACLFLHDNNEREVDLPIIEAVRSLAMPVVPVLCKSDQFDADQIDDIAPGLVGVWERGSVSPRLFAVSAHWHVLSNEERQEAIATGFRRYSGAAPVHEWDTMLGQLGRIRRQTVAQRHADLMRHAAATVDQCATAEAVYDCEKQASHLLPQNMAWLRSRCQGPLGPALFEQVQAAVQRQKPVLWALLRRCEVHPRDIAPTSLAGLADLKATLWSIHDATAEELARIVQDEDDACAIELIRGAGDTMTRRRPAVAALADAADARGAWLAWRRSLRTPPFRYRSCYLAIQQRWASSPKTRSRDTNETLAALRLIASPKLAASPSPAR
jgi:GTP-binding protein EngB required for normal cell division